MKKVIAILFIPIFAVGVLTGCVCGRGKPCHISASEFETHYKYGIGSVTDYTYLGQLDDRAYLRYRYEPMIYLVFGHAPKEMSERILYVNLSELDKPFRDALPPKTPPKP
ncbi:MAG: hypothetical protein ACTHKU_01310 [Verrucomicrobiota bacterium]